MANFNNSKIGERTLPFQGLRVLFMLGIVMLHTCGHPILGSGRELVSFFFIVSGFLYRDKMPWKQYMKKKVHEIYPVYWIILTLFGLICFFRGNNIFHWSLMPHILLLQSWYPNIGFAFEYVGVAWFVSSLMFCYFVSPLLYGGINRVEAKTAGFIIILLFIVLLIVDSIGVSQGDRRYNFFVWLHYANPVYRLLEYMIGMLLWKISKSMQYIRLKISYEPIALSLVVGYIYVIYANGGVFMSTIPL